MSTAIATREVETNLVIASDQTFFNDAQRAALVQMGLGDAPRGDIEAFFHQAKRSGLDPFARQIYMIGRRSKVNGQWVTKYTIQTSIDGFRVIRDRKKTFRGMEEHWCGPDGVWRDVWLEPGPPAAARITLYLDGFVKPVTAVARYDEYVPLKDGQPTGQWGKMPALMTSKVAEALALRKAYPQDFSGLYTSDEMAQADHAPASAPQEQPPAQVEQPKFTDEDVQRWFDQAAAARTVDELGAIWAEAQPLGALSEAVDGVMLGTLLKNLKGVFESAPKAEDVQDAEVVEEQPAETLTWPTVQPGEGGAS
ncbi:RecT family recombinase [Microbacterium sp. XT11]|uniref:RecT family recombinase n=1 Tax=Microbacterium sp. XT11 TaxID=367477 RepID=UPI0007430B03|nr:RecT family recombinase [Microbacterium sp. XT11]ALX66826.1 phage recombination protein Bet [Microbacterium sp. XT11]